MKEGAAVGGLVLLAFVVFGLLGTWFVMLVSGAVGHVFEADAFFISFWQAMVVYLALALVGSFFKK